MELVEKFGTIGPKVIVNKKHPFFGPMNKKSAKVTKKFADFYLEG